MSRFLSKRFLFIENAIAVAFVVFGADRSMGLQLLGFALLLPGSLVAGFIESVIAPLTGRPSGSLLFWNIADVLFLPSCVGLNLVARWFARRIWIAAGLKPALQRLRVMTEHGDLTGA